MTPSDWVAILALLVLVLLYYRHLGRKWSKVPPKPKQPRPRSRTVWGINVGPFWWFSG